MRKWFPGWCSECGREDGYWQDVVEGPETPEAYENRMKQREMLAAIWGPQIKSQLDDDSRLTKYSYKTVLSKELLDDYLTFNVKERE